MAKTIWDPAAQQELRARIAAVRPDARPRWGKMNAAQMLAHLAGALKMANGDLKIRCKGGPLTWAPLRYAIIYLLPMPKGVPTAPELLPPLGTRFDTEMKNVLGALDRVIAGGTNRDFPPHPAFGPLTPQDWGALMYKHTAHHLQQFGV